MLFPRKFALFLLVFALAAMSQQLHDKKTVPAKPAATAGENSASEDISGMYSFLKEGEFLQLNLEHNGVTGYVSREGNLESDRGMFLDHFFTAASVRGHDVAFTTKPVHGVWFEFKGRFDRGRARTKAEDGYYLLRGTLTEFTSDADKNTSSRSRQVEFKLIGQPDEKA